MHTADSVRGRSLSFARLRERRWPVIAVFAGATFLAGGVLSSGRLPLPIAVVLGLVTYWVASRQPRRISIPAATAATVLLGLVLVHAALTAVRGPLGEAVVEGIIPVTAAWFIGDAAAARRRYVAGLAEQAERERLADAERARQELRMERVRIAREMHDVVAHALAVVTVQAGVGRRLMAREPEQASSALESIELIGRTAQEELRVVLGLLREDGIAGAELAPSPRLADLEDLAETVRASGTPVELQLHGTDRHLSPALQLSVYRVVQEALTNVVKHAPGARARVDAAVTETGVRVEIVDDGSAVGPAGAAGALAATPAAPGHGIIGMRERIGAFGGSLLAGPRAGGGFLVLADVPVEGGS